MPPFYGNSFLTLVYMLMPILMFTANDMHPDIRYSRKPKSAYVTTPVGPL